MSRSLPPASRPRLPRRRPPPHQRSPARCASPPGCGGSRPPFLPKRARHATPATGAPALLECGPARVRVTSVPAKGGEGDEEERAGAWRVCARLPAPPCTRSPLVVPTPNPCPHLALHTPLLRPPAAQAPTHSDTPPLRVHERAQAALPRARAQGVVGGRRGWRAKAQRGAWRGARRRRRSGRLSSAFARAAATGGLHQSSSSRTGQQQQQQRRPCRSRRR